MSNQKKTSEQVGTIASNVLKDPNSSKIAKKLAGSALSQVNTNKQPTKEMETTSSNVTSSTKYSKQTKTLAASILSQSDSDNNNKK